MHRRCFRRRRRRSSRRRPSLSRPSSPRRSSPRCRPPHHCSSLHAATCHHAAAFRHVTARHVAACHVAARHLAVPRRVVAHRSPARRRTSAELPAACPISDAPPHLRWLGVASRAVGCDEAATDAAIPAYHYQFSMQRSQPGVLPTWGGDQDGVRPAPRARAPLLLHPLSEGPPWAPPFLPVRDQRPPPRTSARPTALTRGVAAAGVGAWQTSTCVPVLTLNCPTLPRRTRHGGSSRSYDNRGMECSRKGYLGPRTVTTPPQVRATGDTPCTLRRYFLSHV